MDKKIFSDRLDQALREAGITQRELAERMGIEPRSLSRIKRSAAHDLKHEHVEKVAKALELDIGYFLGHKVDDSGYFKVPFREAQAGMGGGCVNGSRKIISHMSFKVDWLMTKTSHPENLSLIKAVGDSMSPTIPPDAVVMIDEGQIEPVKGKIYYLILNNEYIIKRISVDNGKISAIISDNGQVTCPITEGDSIQVLGRALVQVGEL